MIFKASAIAVLSSSSIFYYHPCSTIDCAPSTIFIDRSQYQPQNHCFHYRDVDLVLNSSLLLNVDMLLLFSYIEMKCLLIDLTIVSQPNDLSIHHFMVT